jgi:hypothetical protein
MTLNFNIYVSDFMWSWWNLSSTEISKLLQNVSQNTDNVLDGDELRLQGIVDELTPSFYEQKHTIIYFKWRPK